MVTSLDPLSGGLGSQQPASGDDRKDEAKAAPRMQLSLADFELLRRVGDGSYSHVVLARHRASGKEYALKVIDKQYIMRHKVVDYIRRERAILDRLGASEGVAHLHFTFQDAFSLYLGLDYCPNGELYDQIRLRGRLDADAARAYAAEVVLLLAELRAHGVVHRDLKPENLLLDGEGHLQLIDFGSAKLLPPAEVAPPPRPAAAAKPAAGSADDASAAVGEAGEAANGEQQAAGAAADAEQQAGSPKQQQQQQQPDAGALPGPADGGAAPEASGGSEQEAAAGGEGEEGEEKAAGAGGSKRMVSLVGTADYVSPEVLNNRAVSCAADLWALGCVLYQMLVGRPPFKTPSEYLTFQKIVAAEYALPEGLPPAAADLIHRLLQPEPADRIGAADLAELRAHPFFEGLDWGGLRRQPAPEFVPPEPEPALSSTNSSFDWELQSLASALPHASSADDVTLALDSP